MSLRLSIVNPSHFCRKCRSILAMAQKTGRIVAVCNVLRYAPYFVKMREVIAKGAIGRVISVQHLEPLEHTHMAHSYVSGNWHNSKATTPILLAKSCHDIDIIKWVIDKHSKEIVAMADLMLRMRRKEVQTAAQMAARSKECVPTPP